MSVLPFTFSEFYNAHWIDCTCLDPVDIEPYLAKPDTFGFDNHVVEKVKNVLRDQKFLATAQDSAVNPTIGKQIYATHPDLQTENRNPWYIAMPRKHDKQFGLQPFMSTKVAQAAQELAFGVSVPKQMLVPIDGDVKEAAATKKYCVLAQFPVSAVQAKFMDLSKRIKAVLAQVDFNNRAARQQKLKEIRDIIEPEYQKWRDKFVLRTSKPFDLLGWINEVANPNQRDWLDEDQKDAREREDFTQMLSKAKELAMLDFKDFNSRDSLGFQSWNTLQFQNKIDSMTETEVTEFAEKLCQLIRKTGLDVSIESAYFTADNRLAIVDPQADELLVLNDNIGGDSADCPVELSARRSLKQLYNRIRNFDTRSTNVQILQDVIQKEFIDALPKIPTWKKVLSFLSFGLLPLIYLIMAWFHWLKYFATMHMSDEDPEKAQRLKQQSGFAAKYQNAHLVLELE